MAKIQLLFTFVAAKKWCNEAKFNTTLNSEFYETFGDKHIIIIFTIN